MSVLQKILKWSQNRPLWQRDALRRLILNDELTKDDIFELSEICKKVYGLSDQQDALPLANNHIPEDNRSSYKVVLDSISHYRGVNKLAENQTLEFGPNLTIVYGDNAAGKTGYIRILKNACRARGKEEVLGNVVSGDNSSPTPAVAIKYKVGDEHDMREWTFEDKDDFIPYVSIFDVQSATIYLTEETDAAFRPFGLDLFDKLVKACKKVRSNLRKEQQKLGTSELSSIQAGVQKGTTVAKLLEEIASCTKPTKPEVVKTLARLSPDEESRLALLERSLQDLQANDPEKLIEENVLSVEHIRRLAEHLKAVEARLSDAAVSAVFTARADWQQKKEEAKNLREASFQKNMLDGTGSEHWSALWESARKFSEESAYKGKEFPVVEDGARCLLCQQDIDRESAQRLEQFQAFVVSTTERQLRKIKSEFISLKKGFTDLITTDKTTEKGIEEIRAEDESIAKAVTTALADNERRKVAIVDSLANDAELPDDFPNLVPVADKVEDLVQQFDERIETLRNSTKEEDEKRMNEEFHELKDKKILSKNMEVVLGEIERQKKISLYELCIDDTDTHAITRKSTSVTKVAVTEKLKKSFQDELRNLAFRNVEVELKETGGYEGVLYHKLILTHAPDHKLPRVVSDGEQRCLSIAAFFAELSTADGPSGIVFDDPVSSLDYKWREKLAERLVKEAKKRQVIVFTHDIVFLFSLQEFSEKLSVNQRDQYVQQTKEGAGFCEKEVPWDAKKVKKRIRVLKKEWQDAKKQHEDGNQSAYKEKALSIYCLLRGTWERALEEVLLDGVVKRFRTSIQTQQIKKIADITEEDCTTMHDAMTKCSRWMHDQSAIARAGFPEADELKADIERLEEWVKKIHKRRK